MRNFALLLITFLLLMSCKNSNDEPIVLGEEREHTFLALGDSYTIGESVPEAERWPVQLAAELRERGFDMASPEIIATTGWTTGNLLDAMDRQLDEEQYDLVSVLIGVNNQYQNREISEYEEQLHEIFQQAISHSRNGKEGVFAVSIPDYGATPFGAANAEEIGREIDTYNAVFKEVAEEYGIPFYNITPISRQATSNPDLVAEDDLHPSGEMYRLWVEEIADEVAVLLQN